MASHKQQRKKDFAKSVVPYVVGSMLGVLVNKVASDALDSVGANVILVAGNAQIRSSDIIVVGTELVSAYVAEKKRKMTTKKLLVGMAIAPIAVDTYKILNYSEVATVNLGRNSLGRYGTNTMSQPTRFSSMYPRR